VRDEAYLLDMLLCARQIADYVAGVDRLRFLKERVLQDAVAHQVQNTGEAANRVSVEFQRDHPEIGWADIIGMRHRIVHDYRELDLDVLWETATADVPDLTGLLEPLIPPEESL